MNVTGILSCYGESNNNPARSTPFLCAPEHIAQGLIPYFDEAILALQRHSYRLGTISIR